MTNKIKVKLCGFTQEDSLVCAIKQKVDFVGFVFHEKSPRNVSFVKAKELAKLVPANIFKVAVFKDPSPSDLKHAALSINPQYFQIHGGHKIKDILAIKKDFPQIKIIKAFGVAKKEDLEQSIDFIDACDIFLFDNSVSGSGKAFDWNLLHNFKSEKPWFLSGGLNNNNLSEALKTTGAKMIDVSSGIEKIRGIKSAELIIELMKKIKNVT